jgi:hypothetical protein
MVGLVAQIEFKESPKLLFKEKKKRKKKEVSNSKLEEKEGVQIGGFEEERVEILFHF